MIRKLLLLLIFPVIHYGVSHAQQDKKIDSLLNVLEKQKDDTSKVNILNALSGELMRTSRNSKDGIYPAQKFAEEALRLGEKINFKKGIADANRSIGNNYSHISYNPEALTFYLKELKLRIEIGNQQNIASCYWAVGRKYSALNEYPEALKNIFTALKISETICDNILISGCNRSLSRLYLRQGKYPESLSHLLAFLKSVERTGDKENIIEAYIEVHVFFKSLGNYAEALKYCWKALEISKEIGNKWDVIRCYNFLGDTYTAQANYPEAIKWHLTALKKAEEIKHKIFIGGTHSQIADVYRSQQNFKEALKHSLIHLKMEEETGNKLRIASRYKAIGDIYFEEAIQLRKSDNTAYKDQLITAALNKYFTSLRLCKELESRLGIAGLHEFIGDAYRLNNNLAEALKNYQSALAIRKEAEDKKFISACYIKIGQIYIDLKNCSEARRYLNDGLSLSKESQDILKIRECYEYLSELEMACGNWEEAHKNYRLFILYRDSINNKENTEKMLRFQMQFELERQENSFKYQQSLTDEKLKQQILLAQQQEQTLLLNEKEFALISNENQLQFLEMQKDSVVYAGQKVEVEKKQGQFELLNKEKAIQTLELNKQKQLKKYLLAGLGLLLFLAFFAYRNYRTRQQLKLQTLRNKIASDLHDDIGSTLSSISIFSQMAQQQSKEVAPLLESIGENSRKMLDAMADIVWTINPENDQFEKIILRMRNFAYELLGAKKIDFEFIADDDVTNMKLSMDVRKNLYLIFKEATNNMVKYSGADKALFSIKGEKNNLTMLISDNGKGFDTNQSTNGNGLKNMKKRAEEMGGQFMIDSKPGSGTTIELRIAV